MTIHSILRLRLDPMTERRIEALKRRLGLDASNVVRLAVARLAQLEHVDPPETEHAETEDTPGKEAAAA